MWQLRERRPFETRKDYIGEVLDEARSYSWDTFSEMSELAWRMLDENTKTRIALPTAAAAAAAAGSLLTRQRVAAGGGGPLQPKVSLDASPGRTRPPKRVAAEERSRRASTQERRRRLLYAD